MMKRFIIAVSGGLPPLRVLVLQHHAQCNYRFEGHRKNGLRGGFPPAKSK
jgi:hypothetical protein